MNDRTDQKQKTRRKIIETALNLSAEKGFSALSLREVAKVSGLTPTAFYRHFRDMDDLGLTLIDEVGLGLRQILRESRRIGDNEGASTVRAHVEAFIEYIAKNSNLFRVLQGERQGSSPMFRRALLTEFDRFIEQIADEIDRVSISRKQPVLESAFTAEAIVAVAFTVGAEALDLPKHKRIELTERIIKEIKIILRGSLASSFGAKSKKNKKPNS